MQYANGLIGDNLLMGLIVLHSYLSELLPFFSIRQYRTDGVKRRGVTLMDHNDRVIFQGHFQSVFFITFYIVDHDGVVLENTVSVSL